MLGIDRSCRVSVDTRERKLSAGRRVFLVFPAPYDPVALRHVDLRRHLSLRILHAVGQVAPFHRELHTDVARVVLPIDE